MAVQRDENGRLLPGSTLNPGGKGGRPRTEDAEKLQAALSAVLDNGTLPKWKAAIKKRLERGDQWATEFVFERIVGKVPNETNLHVDANDIDAAIDAELARLASGSQAANAGTAEDEGA